MIIFTQQEPSAKPVMRKPCTPENEATRLARLRELNILDTPPEERFDRVTRLAQRLFNVPIALVSLVDSDRQWFKSRIGLNADETPRSISFCGHTILSDEGLVITDTMRDRRFTDNPLVTADPHIRFYAGMPLHFLDGSRLGTLCIIDTRPRTFSAEDRATLRDLAELVQNELLAIHIAIEDELTQLPNRRGFLSLAQQSLNLCDRFSLPASLVFLDLNRFKQINDTYGHDIGDDALMMFARHLKATVRESDIIGRLSGDEFIAFLPNTDAQDAACLVDRLHESLDRFNRQNSGGYALSFSEGVVPLETDHQLPLQQIIKQADSAMYRKKASMIKTDA